MTLQYKKILCVHTPNGERRLLGDGDKLKKMGVIAGFPDLFIYEPNQEHRGFAIELKINKRKLSINQLKVRDQLLNSGYKYEIVHNIEEFRKEVDLYLSKRF